MFFRTKTSGPRTYLQVVENRWEGGRSRQRVIATLGRLDELQRSGQLDALLLSGARLAESVLILTEHAQGKLPAYPTMEDVTSPDSYCQAATDHATAFPSFNSLVLSSRLARSRASACRRLWARSDSLS